MFVSFNLKRSRRIVSKLLDLFLSIVHKLRFYSGNVASELRDLIKNYSGHLCSFSNGTD